jgi:polyisoprenoid-binding protein YceI
MTNPRGRLTFGPGNARFLIRTGRQGFAAKAGHDLTIEVTRWSAEVDLPGDDPALATVSARVELDSFAVREGTGGAKPLTDGDRREIEQTSRRQLTERGSPVATFASTRLVRADRGGAIEGKLSLYDVTEPIRLQITERGNDRYQASATVRQSAFGIKPYTAFLGALKLRDEVTVEIEFDVAAARADAG